MLSKTDAKLAEQTRAYVEANFWMIDELCDAVGAPVERIQSLIAAGCTPGPIYVEASDHWWSALDRDAEPMPSGKAWYSKGAAWGLRKAIIAQRGGQDDEAAAMALRKEFRAAFAAALVSTQGASDAFPSCFQGSIIDKQAVERAADTEWASWIDGGYGVCLRIFTGASCVTKETLGARMKSALASGDYDAGALLVEAEALADIMLPFAPWQRPNGTPGRTIDRLLQEQGLGHERVYDTR